MVRLYRFQSEVLAEMAAAHLRSRGLPATVVGRHAAGAISWPGQVRAPRWMPGFELVAPKGTDLEWARGLLEAFLSSQDSGEGVAALDEAPAADLSGLDPGACAIDCPACGAGLPLDASVTACAACGGEVDPAERVAELHGPEALAGCYGEVEEGVEMDRSRVDARACAHCGRSLRGMGARGRCPGCGSLYEDPSA